MAESTPLDCKGLEHAYFQLYRKFFDQAEKRRRWSLREDIPWDRVNHSMDPAIADVVESSFGLTCTRRPRGCSWGGARPG